MKKKYIDLLRALGMQDSEARVYFATLHLGPSSVQKIAKEAGVSRTAAYTAIEALIKREIMSTVTRGNKVIYASESPERVLSHLRSEVRHMQEKLEVFEQSVEEIVLAAGGDRPVVRRYEGHDVARVIAQEKLDIRPKEWDEIVNMEDMRKIDPDDEAVKMFTAANKATANKKFRILTYSHMRRHPFRDTRAHRLDGMYPEFHGDIFTYHDRIGLLTTEGKIELILIENKALADTMRILFDLAYAGYDAKKKEA